MKGSLTGARMRKNYEIGTKKAEVAKKMIAKPTGGKMREGSRTHEYWKDIQRRGAEDKKYGAGD